MKNVLLKFAGFFVEKVPINEPPKPVNRGTGSGSRPPVPADHAPASAQSVNEELLGNFPSPAGAVGLPGPKRDSVAPVGIALRAWVPAEHASHLAPFGVHVLAASGELTIEQARAFGAQAIVVSAECLGSHTHLLTTPQMPTVFISPEPVLLPPRKGLVQVQEPLRASDLGTAIREALASWAM